MSEPKGFMRNFNPNLQARITKYIRQRDLKYERREYEYGKRNKSTRSVKIKRRAETRAARTIKAAWKTYRSSPKFAPLPPNVHWTTLKPRVSSANLLLALKKKAMKKAARR